MIQVTKNQRIKQKTFINGNSMIRPNVSWCIDQKMSIGDKVWLRPFVAEYKKGTANYLKVRSHIMNLKPLMKGRIIRFTNAGDKVGVEFEEKIWTGKSRFDNGCHGRGKIGHCVYLFPNHITRRSAPY